MAKRQKQQVEVISVENHETIMIDLVFAQMAALLAHHLTEPKGLTVVQILDFLAILAKVTEAAFPTDHPDKKGLANQLFKRWATNLFPDYFAKSHKKA